MATTTRVESVRVVLASALTEEQRLRFARWLAEHGTLTEWPGQPHAASVAKLHAAQATSEEDDARS